MAMTSNYDGSKSKFFDKSVTTTTITTTTDSSGNSNKTNNNNGSYSELDQRGIDSIIYGRYLLSLLQQHTNVNEDSDWYDTSIGNNNNELDSGYEGSITTNNNSRFKQFSTTPVAGRPEKPRYCESHQRLYRGYSPSLSSSLLSSSQLNPFSLFNNRSPSSNIQRAKDNTQKAPSTTKWMHRRYRQADNKSPTKQYNRNNVNFTDDGNHNEQDGNDDFDDLMLINCPDCCRKYSGKKYWENDYRKFLIAKCLKSAIDKDMIETDLDQFIDEISLGGGGSAMITMTTSASASSSTSTSISSGSRAGSTNKMFIDNYRSHQSSFDDSVFIDNNNDRYGDFHSHQQQELQNQSTTNSGQQSNTGKPLVVKLKSKLLGNKSRTGLIVTSSSFMANDNIDGDNNNNNNNNNNGDLQSMSRLTTLKKLSTVANNNLIMTANNYNNDETINGKGMENVKNLEHNHHQSIVTDPLVSVSTNNMINNNNNTHPIHNSTSLSSSSPLLSNVVIGTEQQSQQSKPPPLPPTNRSYFNHQNRDYQPSSSIPLNNGRKFQPYQKLSIISSSTLTGSQNKQQQQEKTDDNVIENGHNQTLTTNEVDKNFLDDNGESVDSLLPDFLKSTRANTMTTIQQQSPFNQKQLALNNEIVENSILMAKDIDDVDENGSTNINYNNSDGHIKMKTVECSSLNLSSSFMMDSQNVIDNDNRKDFNNVDGQQKQQHQQQAFVINDFDIVNDDDMMMPLSSHTSIMMNDNQKNDHNDVNDGDGSSSLDAIITADNTVSAMMTTLSTTIWKPMLKIDDDHIDNILTDDNKHRNKVDDCQMKIIINKLSQSSIIENGEKNFGQKI
nr:probable cyclin-dependent serine/threonine-protein kinase DDB_G0292550 [Dermatophagoides farinae]